MAAIASALAAGFRVYVVGIGPSVGNLDNFAVAGGTDRSYSATSSQELADAMAAISQKAATCAFSLDQMPPGDLSNLAVYVDKSLVPQDSSRGWSYDATSQAIVLNGASCDRITSGVASTVQVLLVCPGTAPPVLIP
jgi:hypothetical protein